MERRLAAPARSLVGLRVGGTACAVETSAVLGVLGADATLLPAGHASPLVLGLKEHRGALLPIVDLRRWPSLAGDAPAPGARGRWVLVRAGATPFGVAVDEVTGVFDAAPSDERPVAAARHDALVRRGYERAGETLLELDVGVLAEALGRGEAVGP